MLIVNNFNIKCWQYLPPQVGKATYPGERAVQFLDATASQEETYVSRLVSNHF